jgi:hypothetical protein
MIMVLYVHPKGGRDKLRKDVHSDSGSNQMLLLFML